MAVLSHLQTTGTQCLPTIRSMPTAQSYGFFTVRLTKNQWRVLIFGMDSTLRRITGRLEWNGWIPQLLGAVRRHSNRCGCLPLPCSLSYCELNSGRFWEVLTCNY